MAHTNPSIHLFPRLGDRQTDTTGPQWTDETTTAGHVVGTHLRLLDLEAALAAGLLVEHLAASERDLRKGIAAEAGETTTGVEAEAEVLHHLLVEKAAAGTTMTAILTLLLEAVIHQATRVEVDEVATVAATLEEHLNQDHQTEKL